MGGRNLLMVGGILLCLSLVGNSDVSASECRECHKSPVFIVQHKNLFDYFVAFENSVHGLAGLDCTDCHGGDPGTREMTAAHAGVIDSVRYDQIPSTCGRCHQDQHRAFVTSDHYRILKHDGMAPNCVTCHGAMDMDFIFASRVKTTCMFCHSIESGIAPQVPDRADYILSKINIIKGYRSFVETNAKDRDLVIELGRRYDDLSARWHRFDLDRVEEEARLLLGEYRAAKAQAVKDKRTEPNQE
ncbi:MAG: hypothetical protein ABIK96_06705 [bacterium]